VARDDAAPPHPDPTPPPLSLNLKIRRRGRKAEPRRSPSLPPGASRELRRLPPSWALPRAAGPPPPRSTPRRALGCCSPPGTPCLSPDRRAGGICTPLGFTRMAWHGRGRAGGPTGPSCRPDRVVHGLPGRHGSTARHGTKRPSGLIGSGRIGPGYIGLVPG
jgi:hypothetical protein